MIDWNLFKIINFGRFNFSFNISQERQSLNNKQNLPKMMIFNKF